MIIVDPDSIDIITELPDADDIVIIDVKGDKDNAVYTYRIPVKIDLRKALQAHVSDFSIKVLNRPFSEINRIGFLDDQEAEDSTPSNTNQQVDSFSEKNMIRYLNRQKDAIVNEFKTDFKDVLDKQIMYRFKDLTDDELFGTEKIIVVAESNLDPNNNITSIPLGDNKTDDENLTFQQAVDILYQEGGDPASSFESVQDELSLSQLKHGLTLNNYDAVKGKESRLNKIKQSVRDAFRGEGNIELSSGKDTELANSSLNSVRLKSFEINQSLREQKICLYIDVDQTLISESGGQIHLALGCFNMFGLILDTVELTLDHNSFSDDLSIFLPKIRVEATRTGVNKDIIVLEVANESMSEIKANVYYKVTNECGSLDMMRYDFDQSLVLQANESKRIKYSGLDVDGSPGGPQTAGSVLFRITPEVKSYESGVYRKLANTYYASLKSSYMERNVFIPIMTYNRENYIDVELHKIPKNITSIQLFKRNVTKNEREFRPIVNEIGSQYELAVLSNDQNTILYSDYGVRDENFYEYKAKIIYGPGEEYFTINSSIIEYLKPDDVVKLDIQSRGEANGGYSFTVDVEKSLSAADRLFDQISAFGKKPKNVDISSVSNPAFQLFENELKQINSLILDAVLVRVQRFDCTTGENLNIGEFNVEFNQNSSSLGTAVVEDSFGFSSGKTYIYTVQPFVRSVYELLVSINSKLKELAKQSPVAGKNIISQLVRITEEGIESSVGSKYYSRSNYKRGTIQSDKQSVEQVNGDLWLYGRTGNTIYVQENSPRKTVDFINTRVSLIKAVQGLAETYESKLQVVFTAASTEVMNFPLQPKLVRRPVKKSVSDGFIDDIVKISFNLSGDYSDIDYFVITALKDSQNRIVGAIHCPDENIGTFTYIDDSQVGYHGAITYQIFAVTEDKLIQGPFNLGTIIVGSGA
tara:strand:- start:842 stop:3616 length:2775 start_codon:yes stop_codon:yes gene_type:complete